MDIDIPIDGEVRPAGCIDACGTVGKGSVIIGGGGIQVQCFGPDDGGGHGNVRIILAMSYGGNIILSLIAAGTNIDDGVLPKIIGELWIFGIAVIPCQHIMVVSLDIVITIIGFIIHRNRGRIILRIGAAHEERSCRKGEQHRPPQGAGMPFPIRIHNTWHKTYPPLFQKQENSCREHRLIGHRVSLSLPAITMGLFRTVHSCRKSLSCRAGNTIFPVLQRDSRIHRYVPHTVCRRGSPLSCRR